MNEINPIEDIIDPREEKLILTEMAKIEGLQEYLRALLAKDMRLHFTCPKEQHDLVRGAYFRTEWLMKRIKSVSIDNSK